MLECIKIALLVGVLGGISSGIGGILISIIKFDNTKYISGLQQMTAGIMTGIVCFDMLPEAFKIINVFIGIFWVVLGICIIYFVEKILNNRNKKSNSKYIVAIVIMFSMAFHNIIEGMAIGASFAYSISMGITVVIAIILHDIPEGIVVGISNNMSGNYNLKNIFFTILIGAITGIGTFFGKMIGNNSENFIGISFCIASGVMFYIISCELIPESHNNYSSKKVNILYIVGIIVGVMISYM